MGKARQKETAEFWVQDALERQEFWLIKVREAQNPPDVLTKLVGNDVMCEHLEFLGCGAVPMGASA